MGSGSMACSPQPSVLKQLVQPLLWCHLCVMGPDCALAVRPSLPPCLPHVLCVGGCRTCRTCSGTRRRSSSARRGRSGRGASPKPRPSTLFPPEPVALPPTELRAWIEHACSPLHTHSLSFMRYHLSPSLLPCSYMTAAFTAMHHLARDRGVPLRTAAYMVSPLSVCSLTQWDHHRPHPGQRCGRVSGMAWDSGPGQCCRPHAQRHWKLQGGPQPCCPPAPMRCAALHRWLWSAWLAHTATGATSRRSSGRRTKHVPCRAPLLRSRSHFVGMWSTGQPLKHKARGMTAQVEVLAGS
jgi:hypothetical protein